MKKVILVVSFLFLVVGSGWATTIIGDTISGNFTVNGNDTAARFTHSEYKGLVIRKSSQGSGENALITTVNENESLNFAAGGWTNNPSITLLPNGFFGIGTIAPSSLLTLKKNNWISVDTIDGTDDGALFITGGGGAGSYDRGANIMLFGNERQNNINTGSLKLIAGNTNEETGGNIIFSTGPSGTKRMIINKNGNVGIGTTEPSSILTLIKDNTISVNTIDGSDDGALSISGGGGAASYNRAANIKLFGNERLNNINTGSLRLIAGATNDETGGNILFSTGPSGTDRMSIDKNGNIGIGTIEPNSPFEVKKNWGGLAVPLVNFEDSHDGYVLRVKVNNKRADMPIMSVENNDGPVFKITGDGKVRSKEIIVENSISANDLNIKSNNWADYVFEDDYKLQPLSEIESFVKENKHLPEVPSANEIKEDGLNMSVMMELQMKKIEELTLHLIEQNKQMINQNKMLSEQNIKVASLIKENAEIKKELALLK